MNTDIVTTKDGKYVVYPREAFDGYDYDGDPLFTGEDEGECADWCEEHRHTYRVRRCSSLVPPWFLRDVEHKADRYMQAIRECGLAVETDVTYRASAAWKEQPVHYAYSGDFGGCAKLRWDKGAEQTRDRMEEARDYLNQLFGMSTALWELGFTLTFDKDGKHTIYGNFPRWVTIDSEN